MNVEDVEEVCKGHDNEKNNDTENTDVGNCVGDQSDVISGITEESHPIEDFDPQKEYCKSTQCPNLAHSDRKLIVEDNVMNDPQIVSRNAVGEGINAIPIVGEI